MELLSRNSACWFISDGRKEVRKGGSKSFGAEVNDLADGRILETIKDTGDRTRMDIFNNAIQRERLR